MKTRYAQIAVVILMPGVAFSQETDGSLTLTYGAGFVASSGVYVGQKDEVLPFPILTAIYGNWTADVARGVRYTVLSTGRMRADVGLGYSFAPDLPDTTLFKGLERDGNVELVASFTHDFDQFDVGFEFGADVSSVHDGLRADLSVGRTRPVGLFQVEGRLGVAYLDADFANHLFGVGQGEATETRAAYAPGDTWTPRIELSAAVPFENGIALVGFIEYRRLPDAVFDSPLVADREQTSIGLALMRSF